MSGVSVVDEGREFDHFNVAAAQDPYPLLGRLREECPVARSDQHGGFWLFTRYAEVSAALRDHETYSSTVVSIPPTGPGVLPVPPLDQDPPVHTRYRQMLLPFFTPQRTTKLEPMARQTARRLVADLVPKRACEGMAEYCMPMPTVVLATILGVPPEDQPMFCEWLVKIVEEAADDPAGAKQANVEIYAYLGALLEARRSDPRDDILTFLLAADLDGAPLTHEQRLGIATLLLIAGIDTTANTLGTSLWHLASEPAAQRALRDGPELMNTAVEELLRAFSPVSISRIVTADVRAAGCPIARDEQVLLSLPSANRDERKYPNAASIVLDREVNPHLAFGVGIHRCLGAHIARMEMRVGLEEFLAAVPEFRLDDPGAVTWKAGPMRGPKQFQLAF
jgi:cytochrome P450